MNNKNNNDDIIKLVNDNAWTEILHQLKSGTLNPRTVINQGNTISHIAFNQDIMPVINYLINTSDHIPALKQLNSDGQSCLHILVNNAKYDTFLQCLKTCSDKSLINTTNSKLKTTISLILKYADNDVVLKLLKELIYKFKNIDYSLLDNNNKCIIHAFIKKYVLNKNNNNVDKNTIASKLFKLLKYIIAHKDINLNYPDKLLPLIYCLNLEGINDKTGYEIIKLLLDNGADPNKYPSKTPTALSLCVKKNLNKIAKLLLDHKANPNYQGSYGLLDPMFGAIEAGNNDMISTLLDYKYDCRLYDKYLNTAAHQALIKEPPLKYSTLVKILCNKSTDMHQKNINNDTPLNIIQIKYDPQLFKPLLDYKLKNNIKSSNAEKNNKNQINFPVYQNNHAKSFVTTPLYNILYTMCILTKHKNIVIPFQYDNNNFKTNTLRLLSYNYRIGNNTLLDIITSYTHSLYSYLPHLILWKGPNEYFIDPNLEFNITKCMNINSKARFIMMKISLLVSDNSTHANILIIDKKTGNVDRFDPYGFITLLDTHVLDKVLEKKLTRILKPFFKVNYLRAQAGYNLVSFQTISNDDNAVVKKGYDPFGYCLAWCFWYLELRVTNPDVHPHYLIKYCIKQIIANYSTARTNYTSSEEITETNIENIKKFNDYIRSYAANLDNEKNKLLMSFGIDKNNTYDIIFSNTLNLQIINGIDDLFINKIAWRYL